MKDGDDIAGFAVGCGQDTAPLGRINPSRGSSLPALNVIFFQPLAIILSLATGRFQVEHQVFHIEP